jgi:hypothetical protein
MKRNLLIFGVFLLSCLSVSAQIAPPTLVLEGEILAKNLAESKHNPNPAIVEIIKDAEKIVKAGKLFSVINKEQVPPSGDKHDYMSQAPYWWADPSKPNGLPYIRRDGERNPELNKITDEEELGKMRNEVEVTAIAYFLSGREEFAEHSAKLIRTWFIAEKTKMNPSLNYAQGIPGITKGRGFGLIETRELYRVIDAAILLKSSKFWTEAEHILLKKWFADFAKWMMDSNLGKDEANAKNNHGTYYDVQLISYLIFTRQTNLAKKQLEISKQRLKNQLAKDGSQPEELERTLSWDYSFMNLFGFLTIARLAENVGVDFWSFETDGKGIKKALEWHKSFVKGDKKWTHQQIKAPKMDNTFRVFSIAARKYKNNEFRDLTEKIKQESKITKLDLLTR